MSRRTATALVVHIVTATFRRHPLLPSTRDGWIRDTMCTIARKWKADLLAIGGGDDHLHIATQFPPALSVSELVGYLKGTSAYLWNLERIEPTALHWQDGFWAETCRPDELDGLLAYVDGQRDHHASQQFPEPWEFALGSFAERTL